MGMGGGNRHTSGGMMKAKAASTVSSTSFMFLLTVAILTCTFFLATRNSDSPDYSEADSSGAAVSRRFLGKELPVMSDRTVLMQQTTQSEQRKAMQSVIVGSERKPISFMLVTAERPDGCKTMDGSHMLMKSYKNKVDYCSLHNCRVWYSLEVWDEGMPGTWARYKLIKTLMNTFPDVPWFMWMDGDAIFTDMGYAIPFADYDEWGKRIVFHGFEDKVYGDNPDWTGINAGVFLMKNCDFSKDFMDKWIAMGDPAREREMRVKLNAELPSRPRDWPADDQSALVYILRENKLVTERNSSQDDYNRVYLELRYFLHGYWKKMTPYFELWRAQGNLRDSKEEMDRWSFVTHFVGCKICSGEYASSDANECKRQFERAYTFADQQILALAGMEHTALGTQKVRPTLNGMRTYG